MMGPLHFCWTAGNRENLKGEGLRANLLEDPDKEKDGEKARVSFFPNQLLYPLKFNGRGANLKGRKGNGNKRNQGTGRGRGILSR